MKKLLSLLLSLSPILLLAQVTSDTTTKNLILIIVDGAGYGSWHAAAAYEGRDSVIPLADAREWTTLSCMTYPLKEKRGENGVGRQDNRYVYRPQWFLDTAPTEGSFFMGYHRAKKFKTDSAASATALASGQKTYNAAINWNDQDTAITAMSEVAKRNGKSVGMVTTVQICHATPAGLGGGHSPHRDSYLELSSEMVNAGTLDVWMGAGHPEIDPSGKPLKDSDVYYKYVGGRDNWSKLRAGNHPGGWTLIEERVDFQKLISADTTGRVLGVAKSQTCTQYDRKKGMARRTDVPTLAEMSLGAINVLSKNPNGFWLGIEAGATDWANHANNFPRLIEEMSEMFDLTDSLCARLDAGTHGVSWDNTLVIITADHSTGLLLGPNSDSVFLNMITSAGKGVLPKHRYHHTNHSAYPVPLFIRGKGAKEIERYIRGTDPVFGPCIDNTDIYPFTAQRFGFSKGK